MNQFILSTPQGERYATLTDLPLTRAGELMLIGALRDGFAVAYETSGTPRSSDRRRRELDGLGCKVVMVVREGPGNFDWQLVNAGQLRADVVACARAMGEEGRREAAAKAARS